MNLDKLNALAAQLKTMRPLNATELKRLNDEFVIENTYNSNAIEGNTLTLRETALVLQEGITIAEKPIKEHLEAIGHKDAYGFIVELAGKDAELTEWVIKQIHSLVLMNDRANSGVYRSIPVKISGAVHTPPPHYLVPEQIEQLITDYKALKATKQPIEAIAEFHLRFEGVHPFIDGNGRTGRLILNLELIKAGLLPINIKFSDRRKYYECFDNYYGNGHTAETLVSLIADYEAAELTRYIDMLK